MLNTDELQTLYMRNCDCIIPGVCVYMSKERFAILVMEIIKEQLDLAPSTYRDW